MGSLSDPDKRLAELREAICEFDESLHREFPFEVAEVRDSNAGNGVYAVKGHASVFNKWSLDLGGFRERVAKGAFDNVLSRDPHVLHTWDHDTSKTLASTRSKEYPLELRTDPAGLRFYSKVAPTSYARDLRVLLDGGVIDQSSFAFTVEKDEWKVVDEGDDAQVERTIIEVRDLFDVTTCAMGAYPTTDSVLAVRSLLKPATRTTVAFRHSLESSGEPAPESQPDPIPDPGPQPSEPEPPADAQAEPAAPPEDGATPADEQAQRDHEEWQLRRKAEYRRTREFAYGVTHTNEEKP